LHLPTRARRRGRPGRRGLRRQQQPRPGPGLGSRRRLRRAVQQRRPHGARRLARHRLRPRPIERERRAGRPAAAGRLDDRGDPLPRQRQPRLHHPRRGAHPDAL
ncbi:hypothetical protein LTR94_030305, partial [Friedmanniomyces endolithicus]